MDNDTFNSLVFMILGLGFFMFVMHYITKDNDVMYQRRLNEAREFGYGAKGQHNVRTLNKK